MTKIIIDAGHGGKNFGATAGNYIEKQYNLGISLEQRCLLTKLGYEVELTRDIDKTVLPLERANMVKESGADYCISNHLNAGNREGAEVIHSIFQDGKLANEILNNLGNAGLKKRRVFCKALNSKNNKDWYFMHRDTGKVRTVIVEYAFIDNEKDMNNFLDNWEAAALAVVVALDSFIKRFNKKN